jgi:[ribosomal protein S5]-alanine N-acetyltransferase
MFLLETPRLTLREIDPIGDAAAFVDLNSDPEVMRYTGDVPFASEAAARTFFLERLQHYALAGMGRWVVELKNTGELLGWCGLKRDEDSGEVDLGYRFFRHHWGHGYATEASRVCLDYGFGPLALERIIAHIDPANNASLGVARKLGMRQLPGLTDCGGLHATTWELTRAEWAN